VAEDYARNAGHAPPTAGNPAYVYQIEISNPATPGVTVIDPVFFVASHHQNPLVSPSYHHDGNQNFLLCVVNPALFPMPANIRYPPSLGGAPRAPLRTQDLETLVRALRDSEVLVLGNLPRSCVQDRHDIV
jgi:hypothetical protein